jgi:hypothetical protein
MRTRVVAVAGLLVVSAVVGAACSAGDDGGDAGAGGGGGFVAETAGLAADRASPAASPAPKSRGALSAAELPSIGPSVIKTADLTVAVGRGEVDEALADATRLAATLGGFVASSSISAGDAARGSIVLRVPSDRFERALTEFESLGSVEHKTISGQDVSQQVIDLEARLRNWQSQEAVLLRLMDRAETVSDTIRVQGELSRVQLEVERLRGRLGYLRDQTDLGTISTTFTGGPLVRPEEPSTLARAWAEARRAALSVVAAVIVGAGFVVPVALLGGAVALVVRALLPRLTSRAASP